MFSPGIRYLLIAALSFSVMVAAVKQLGTTLPTAEIMLFRAGLSIVFSWWAVRRIGESIWGHNKPLLLLRGLVGALALFCVFYGAIHLPLAEATVIQFLYPLFTAALAVAFLHESVRPRLWLCWLLSLLGVALVVRPTGEPLPLFDVGVALAGAFLTACAYVLVRKLSASENPHVIVFYFPLVVFPLALPWSLGNWVTPVGWQWPLLLAVGVFTQFGQVYLTKGFREETAVRATAISYVQVVFAASWGVLFFHQLISWPLIIGAFLILSAALLNAWPQPPQDD